MIPIQYLLQFLKMREEKSIDDFSQIHVEIHTSIKSINIELEEKGWK